MTDNKLDPEQEKRIQEIISKMTLSEKIREMSPSTRITRQGVMLFRYNYWTWDAGGNKRLGIPKLRFTDGPRGVSLGNSTCFPVSMARGASFDPELEERIGSAMGYEARAQGANFYGGVCINLLRHPGWGRAQETFGEDPYHLGIIGSAMVRGLQKHLIACIKHYACNSIENSRFYVNVKIDERTLREIYLPHFKRCIDEAQAGAVMSAYNKVNGEFCGHNYHLLTEILKKEWGFEGLVMSDFLWGLKDGKAGANAGLDIEMPRTRFYGRNLKKLVLAGEVPEEKIDDAARRILRQKLRFARVGEPVYEKNKVAGEQHRKLALESARKSIVLLKNHQNTLPLNRESLKTIAVFGKLGNRANLGDVGSSRVRPPYAITPLQGIKNQAGDAINVLYSDGAKLETAKKLARSAEAVIIIAGLTAKQEGEYIPFPIVNKYGGDRTELGLSQRQENLIKELAKENPKTIVVLEAGSAIIMEGWKDKAPAILFAWYPGMEGGNAIAEIIFGEVNPSGKLPIVFPKSTDQLPYFDPKIKEIEYGYYHGYRWFDKKNLEPAFAFGFGLSYTSYKYSNLRLDKKEIKKSEKIRIQADITNLGERAGEEIVQLYVGFENSKIDRPIKELKGFARIFVLPKETKTVSFELKPEELAYYNPNSKSWEIEEMEYNVYVASSSRKEDLKLKGGFKISK